MNTEEIKIEQINTKKEITIEVMKIKKLWDKLQFALDWLQYADKVIKNRDNKICNLKNKIDIFKNNIEGKNGKEVFKNSECVICLNNTPSILFCNCGHLCICEECDKLSTSSDCPVCREKNYIKRKFF